MISEKLDVQLNLAISLPEAERERSQDLYVGFEPATREWELIVRYVEDITFLREKFGAKVDLLLGGYAIVIIKEEYVDQLITFDEIIYVEKPNRLFLAVAEARREVCLPQQESGQGSLSGKEVLVAVIDSGIDYSHPDFRKDDGTTRIVELWDQTISGNPPYNYDIGTIYTMEQINEALKEPTKQRQNEIVPEIDFSGHGTMVAGIAAGNGRASDGINRGIAYESDILVVKLANATANNFPRTTQLMLALDYVVRYALEHNQPVAINLSFGNNYGSHDGNILLETFIDEITNQSQVVVCIGSGNEGNTGRHVEQHLVNNGPSVETNFVISEGETGLTLQIWKQYADQFDTYLITPGQERLGPFSGNEVIRNFVVENTNVQVYYGEPRPYMQAQEIYLDFIANRTYIASGQWGLLMVPRKIVNGQVNMWLPVKGPTNEFTRFLQPTVDTTLTIPSTARKSITVSAYNNLTNAFASFSGRGFTRINEVKPDLAAPGVQITSCAVGGGYSQFTGTSVATPFVTGAAALMMEWGIVNGNDVYLYGEKVKAYLIRGARKLPGEEVPSPKTGWGALCVSDSLPGGRS